VTAELPARQKRGGRGVEDCMRSYPLIHATPSETEQQFDSFVEGHGGSSGAGPIMHDDVAESVHVLRFSSGWISHSIKEIEALGGRLTQFESRFEIAGPAIPRGCFSYDEVESIVRGKLDELRAGLRTSPDLAA
jgi:hypothetical protein